jgi:hypothetical protein
MQARRITYHVLIISVVISIAWVILKRDERRLQKQRLPDGSWVVLRGVGYGTSHRFLTGNLWQRAAASILPTKYASRFPSLVYNNTNEGPTLMVWIEHINAPTNGSIHYGGYPAYGNPPDWQGLFDDSGTDFESSPDVSSRTVRGYLQGFAFHGLPSTSANLHFRFVCADAQKSWQSRLLFTFSNPIFRNNPQKHFSYPFTAQRGNLKVVLNRFAPDRRKPKYPIETGLSLDIFENETPATNWSLHSLVVLDEKGGIYRPYSSGWGQSDNHIGASFVGGLSTNAPWNLRLAFKHSTFLSNEICTIKGLSTVSDNNSENATNLVCVPFLGTTLIIQRPAHSQMIQAMIAPPDENYYLDFVDVIAANGQPFDRGQTYSAGQTDSHYWIGFPPGITNVDLTFGITRKVFIDVVAQPTSQ